MTPFTTPQASEHATLDLHATRRVDPPAGGLAPPVPRRLHSQGLFDGATEIEIEHQQQVYRLRKTSLGKLILTK